MSQEGTHAHSHTACMHCTGLLLSTPWTVSRIDCCTPSSLQAALREKYHTELWQVQASTQQLPYCLAHRRSQLKRQNLGVGGYMEKVLKWFNYLRARAHPRCEVGTHGAKLTCIVGSSVLHQGQPNSREGCMVYKADQLIASLLSFRSDQLSPAVREFCTGREECCEQSHRQVCVNLMLWRPKCIRAMWAQRTYLWIHYARISMVGGYTENSEKQQNCQKWGVDTCMGMGTCSGQYGNPFCNNWFCG